MTYPKDTQRKKRSSSKEDKAKQMDKILDGSLKLISDKGFHGFGMRALAKHIGMSQGNLYHYISSQRELWIAVRIKCMRDFKEKLEKIANFDKSDAKETLIKMGKFVFEFAEEDINRWKLMTIIKPPEPPIKEGEPFVGEIEKNYVSTRILDVVFDILKRGREQGQLKELNFEIAGFYLYSVVLGITFTEYDLLTEDLMRDPEIGDKFKFDREDLRDFALNQLDLLLRKQG